MNNPIAIDELRQLLKYDKESGSLTWLQKRGGDTFPGDVAGAIDRQGYRVITIKGRQYQAHRIAWALHHGEWPAKSLDHRNLNKDDNRIVNLRLATGSQNIHNIGIRSTNTSGKKGVTWNKQCGKWQSQIKIDGKNKYLGLFESIDEAHAAYCAAANENLGEFSRTA